MNISLSLRACLPIVFGTLLLVGVAAGQSRDPQRAELEAVRQAVRLGKVVALEGIIADALRRVPGRVIEVEVDLEDGAYEIEVLDGAGKVWELEYRASTGELLEIERD